MPERTAFTQLRRKIVLEHLDKYPDAPSRSLARLILKETPEIFRDAEDKS